ncbi:MAG TPA: ZIP family metal transporter [Firmicutes bacterium]|jgi:ZIP family zinc transporter|nr:ZIP family metal transporter [Bacillota bacterium]
MDWLDITLIGFIAGTFGTSAGGLLSFIFLKPSNKILGIMLSIAAGVMLSIIFMELLGEALANSYAYTILGLLAGITAFLALDNLFPHKHFVTEEVRQGRYFKKGLLIATGIALHNISEGIAIGAGFAASTGMGITLAVLISLHNIPEGLAVAIPLNIGGVSRAKVFGITILAGLPMGIGAMLGSVTGNISAGFLALSLSFAAGAMLYIVFDELVPDVLEVTDNHIAIWGITAGILIGITMVLYL